jgi:hypothetical protein
MNKIILTTKLTMDDFVKVNYHLLYRRWFMKYITGLGIFMILMIVYYYVTEPGHFETFPFYQFFFGMFVTVGMPVATYFTARRNYKSNSRISEVITYEFDSEFIQVTGESFNSKLTWEKIYRLTENTDWILIWQNRQIANVIPKRDFKPDDVQNFKDLVKNIKGPKNRLKR